MHVLHGNHNKKRHTTPRYTTPLHSPTGCCWRPTWCLAAAPVMSGTGPAAWGRSHPCECGAAWPARRASRTPAAAAAHAFVGEGWAGGSGCTRPASCSKDSHLERLLCQQLAALVLLWRHYRSARPRVYSCPVMQRGWALWWLMMCVMNYCAPLLLLVKV